MGPALVGAAAGPGHGSLAIGLGRLCARQHRGVPAQLRLGGGGRPPPPDPLPVVLRMWPRFFHPRVVDGRLWAGLAPPQSARRSRAYPPRLIKLDLAVSM